MKDAERVTFGGSDLDRAGLVRLDAARVAQARRDPASRAMLIWRGKPLFAGEQRENLARLPLDHPVVAGAGAAMLLGREAGGFVFVAELSDWSPGDLDEAALAAFFDRTEQSHPDLPADHAFCELRAVMTRLDARDAELAATARALTGWHRTHAFCARCGAPTVIAAAGWQRDCPDCGGHHFPRTDPVVIMAVTLGNDMLVGRSLGWPPGMYSLLAGFVEPGETIEAAVRRETFEEAGVRVGAVRYLASQPWPWPSSLMLGCQGAALSREITLDPAEIEDARWISREEMLAVFAGEQDEIMPARAGSIAHFILRNWLADRLH